MVVVAGHRLASNWLVMGRQCEELDPNVDSGRRLRQPLGERSDMMITVIGKASHRTTSLREYSYFVSFTGRYACGRPEICRRITP
jgi:hypothetical protein